MTGARLTSHQARSHRIHGYTMVELLVTMAVSGILLALAVPSYTGTIARTKTRGFATELTSSLSRTRSEALTRNLPVSITAKSGAWIQGWTINEVGSTSPHIENHGAAGGLSVSGPTSVSFSPSGRLNGAPPVFVITSTGNEPATTCVSVDLTGRPYTRKGATC